MQDLVAAISSREDQDRFPDTMNQFNKYSEDLSVLDGVPMFGRRLIFPASLRQSVLNILHSDHQCSVKMQGTLCSVWGLLVTLRGPRKLFLL